jgi:transcriptional regulator with PAS, ATPase and Fis domain
MPESQRPEDFDPPTLMRKSFIGEPIHFSGMVGRSAPMRALFSLLKRAAAAEATVLIEGETGTGKEASADAIHTHSRRRDGPFVVVDCGAVPPQLLESELFGHERGSFTGATTARRGAFEAASGGTIFLDEIGELGLDLQPKLLRAIERRHIKRIGSTSYTKVDVRVVAATNRSLKGEVAAQRFRSDLFYRLAVIEIILPPLRERLSDLPLLVDNILEVLGATSSPEIDALRSPDFLSVLSRYRWPGNIRQLRNYLERCVALGDMTTPPGTDTVPPPAKTVEAGAEDPIDLTQPLRVARDACVARFERRYLEALLARHNNNVSGAARAAGVDRIHFYRMLWKHGLRSQPNGKDDEGPRR